jgi:ATP-dependent exoDNAse (exonuclease V) beta subunit
VNRFTGAVIPSYLMEEGAEKGKDLHKGCQLLLQGGLDWDSLDIEYVAPLQQFEKWLKQFQIEPLYTETMFYHPKMNYCGTIDLIAVVDKVLSIVDFKTGECSTVDIQLSAYKEGWTAQEKYYGKVDKYALWLPKNGNQPKLEKITVDSFQDFKACMILKPRRK